MCLDKQLLYFTEVTSQDRSKLIIKLRFYYLKE